MTHARRCFVTHWKSGSCFAKKRTSWKRSVKEGRPHQSLCGRCKGNRKRSARNDFRTHPDLVKRLFETEVPEIYDGTVEIKAVSREAGSRTKLAVLSHNADVDAVGACIGSRGARVSNIVNELNGEKIDIIEYSEDPAKFIAASLSPADVLSVVVTDEDARACRVTVPDSQLSLAIGNKGQNARLAAKLTGWKIDIKPESGFMEKSRKRFILFRKKLLRQQKKHNWSYNSQSFL